MEPSPPIVEKAASADDGDDPERTAGEPVEPQRTRSPTGFNWPVIDSFLFVAFAGAAAAYVVFLFVGSMLQQTNGQWSAPLDDVFIHFDYARSTARGHPFQWSEGNGYSSGDTSFTYPVVLALGYRIGFTGFALMKWAAIVAVASISGFFIGAKALFAPLGSYAKWLLPPLVLSVGVLDFSLASGMENALLLGVLGAVLATIVSLEKSLDDAKKRWRFAWLLGALAALLFLTRPEAAVMVLTLSVYVFVRAKRFGTGAALSLTGAALLPSLLAAITVALSNRLLTGDWVAAGAISKLAISNPYLSATEIIQDYKSNFIFIIAQTTRYHLADRDPYGFIPVLLALVPLAHSKVRRFAILVWAMAIGWVLVISLNAQVCFQNERYAMPAVALLLMLSALGVGVLVASFGGSWRTRSFWAVRAAVAGAAVSLFAVHELPRFREQERFFGRASRNIRDQQIAVGLALGENSRNARRLLVNDAGAITYASDTPGVDLVGLGGYHDLPFACASREGIGATIELIERMHEDDRPDVMAIYPEWWGDLVTYFGQYAGEVSIDDNEICGAATTVIYRANWDSLDRSGDPRSIADNEHVVSELDVADLVSERLSKYQSPPPEKGQVVFRVLNDPEDKRHDLFDAGRTVRQGEHEGAELALPPARGRLIVRTTSTSHLRIGVRLDGREIGSIEVVPSDGWVEPSIALPASLKSTGHIELEALDGTFVDFHVWVVEARE